jgi:hypothetical protein
MSNSDIQTAVSRLYYDLEADGYDPLAIAAIFMVTAFTVYSKQLTPETYTEVISRIFSTATAFIDKSNRTLH